MREAFVTGSHAYGTPHEKSDVDLIVPADSKLGEILAEALGIDPGKVYQGGLIGHLKVDNLDIIFVDEWQWHAWREATDQLVEEKPVTRDRACEVIQAALATIPPHEAEA